VQLPSLPPPLKSGPVYFTQHSVTTLSYNCTVLVARDQSRWLFVLVLAANFICSTLTDRVAHSRRLRIVSPSDELQRRHPTFLIES